MKTLKLFLREKELSDEEKKKQEEIVKKLKTKKDEFKKRYGDKWKEVMYATATKMAKEKISEEETLNEFSIFSSDDIDTQKAAAQRFNLHVKSILEEIKNMDKAVRIFAKKAKRKGPSWVHVNTMANWHEIIRDLSDQMYNRASKLSSKPLQLPNVTKLDYYDEEVNEEKECSCAHRTVKAHGFDMRRKMSKKWRETLEKINYSEIQDLNK